MALIESPYITDPNDPRLKDQLSLPALPLGLDRQAGMRLISGPQDAAKPSLMAAPQGFHEQGPTSGRFESPVHSPLAPDQGHEETADSILPKTLQEPTEFLAPKSKLNTNALGKAAYENERPQITAKPGTADFFQQNQSQQLFDNQHPLGSPVSKQPGILGKIEHGIGRAANIAADIAAPQVAAFIPGSDVNKGILQNDLNKDFDVAKKREDSETAEKDRTNLESQRNELEKQRVAASAPGKTPEELTIHDLMTGDNGQPKINTDTQKPFTYLEAYSAVKQAGQDVKPKDENKQPVGGDGVTRHTAQLNTLTEGMNPQEKQAFLSAYAVHPEDSLGVATKRLEDAKASAQMSGSERDRKIQRDIASQNHEDQVANRDQQQGLQTVQYRTKDGELLSGSLEEARAAGGTGIRKTSPADEQKARTAITQYGRLLQNGQAASDSMGAWDSPKDKQLAIRMEHNFFAHAIIPGVGIDPNYVNALQNSDDFKAMSPLAQAHQQNMLQLYSDAINMLKLETGGVPRGEQFLKTEGAILPSAEKTQAQNRQALKQFEKRIKTDSSEYARPSDMEKLGGIVPPGARPIAKQGRIIGYLDTDGKRTDF
jgi:hypothetical protein